MQLILCFIKKKNQLKKGDEVIVPGLSWSTTYFPLQQCGLKLKFVDINMNNLCMDEDQLINSINNKTKAVFLTHAQGFNGLNSKILRE